MFSQQNGELTMVSHVMSRIEWHTSLRSSSTPQEMEASKSSRSQYTISAVYRYALRYVRLSRFRFSLLRFSLMESHLRRRTERGSGSPRNLKGGSSKGMRAISSPNSGPERLRGEPERAIHCGLRIIFMLEDSAVHRSERSMFMYLSEPRLLRP
jgi:hypothetical protein